MSLHKNLTGLDIHTPISYTYATEALRLVATGFTASDVGKLARQLDDNGIYMLVNYTSNIYCWYYCRLNLWIYCEE